MQQWSLSTATLALCLGNARAGELELRAAADRAVPSSPSSPARRGWGERWGMLAALPAATSAASRE